MRPEKKIVIIAGPNGANASTDRFRRQSMTKKTQQGSKDPDILASFKALRRAARRALELGRQTGTPVYVIKDGKIVDLTANDPNRRRPKT